jgi:hypothetical protein
MNLSLQLYGCYIRVSWRSTRSSLPDREYYRGVLVDTRYVGPKSMQCATLSEDGYKM